MDCKATVKIGEFSRGGLSRGDNKACDHDFATQGSHTPCGIVDEDSGDLYINMGCSHKTSDFIADTLDGWWKSLPPEKQQSIDKIQLKSDNGPESSGIRTQFLKRIVEFSDAIGKPIQLLYFPPYHSKYNPIERCWGILELHWNGTLLSDVNVMVKWAETMLWSNRSAPPAFSWERGHLGRNFGGRDARAPRGGLNGYALERNPSYCRSQHGNLREGHLSYKKGYAGN